MLIAVWIVSGILAALYLAAGLMKSLRPKSALEPMIPWTEDYSAAGVKLIGLAEVLGALGLLAPLAGGLVPALAPILPSVAGAAAVGLALVQLLAIPMHLRRGERQSLPVNAILAAAAIFVAITRFAGV